MQLYMGPCLLPDLATNLKPMRDYAGSLWLMSHDIHTLSSSNTEFVDSQRTLDVVESLQVDETQGRCSRDVARYACTVGHKYAFSRRQPI